MNKFRPFPPLVSSRICIGITALSGCLLHAQVTFIPGEVSGYSSFTSPQATVNASGRAIATQQYSTSRKQVISWTPTVASVVLPGGGFTDYFTTSISDPGRIFGYGTTGNQTRPLRWDSVAAAPTVLGALRAAEGEAFDARVTAVTPAGLAVGYSTLYDEFDNPLGQRGVVWEPFLTTPVELPLASSNDGFGSATATCVSPAGVVAGNGTLYVDGVTKGTRGIRWQKTAGGTLVTTSLNAVSLDAAGAGVVDVKAVNDLGTVAGNSRKYDGAVPTPPNTVAYENLGLRAVRWDAGSSTPTVLGILGTTATGVNADTTVLAMDRFGNIVGLSQLYVGGAAKGTRPVVWKAGTTAAVALPIYDPDPSSLTTRGNMSAMNSAGYVAGTMQGVAASGRKATVWHIDGAIYNLNDYLPAGYPEWTLTNCTDIDDSGWIAGYATYDPDGTGPIVGVERYFSMHVPAFAAKAPASSANLAVSKIMYRPLPGVGGEVTAGYTSSDEFEYLEFVNIGTEAIDLMGLKLTGDVTFDFTQSFLSRVLEPGARVLVVSNKAAFDLRYGAGKPVAGAYAGHLPDAGGHVVLSSASNEVVAEVTYGGTSNVSWPAEAAEAGHSLVRRSPDGSTTQDNDAANWRASVTVGGTPGVSDALSYATWKTANGVGGQADADDLDADGLNTFQEYAQAGTPGISDARRQPTISTAAFTVGSMTSDYAVIRYSRRFAADDVTYTLEASNTLQAGSWSSAGVVVWVSANRESDGSETVVYRSALPLQGEGAPRFFRVKMQSP